MRANVKLWGFIEMVRRMNNLLKNNTDIEEAEKMTYENLIQNKTFAEIALQAITVLELTM